MFPNDSSFYRVRPISTDEGEDKFWFNQIVEPDVSTDINDAYINDTLQFNVSTFNFRDQVADWHFKLVRVEVEFVLYTDKQQWPHSSGCISRWFQMSCSIALVAQVLQCSSHPKTHTRTVRNCRSLIRCRGRDCPASH